MLVIADLYKEIIFWSVIVVVVVMAFFGGLKYQEIVREGDSINRSFDVGVQYGFISAVGRIILSSQDCNVVPVIYQNFTVNLVDVKCVEN